ncbi:hypothetical protein OAN307_c16290 [Octadecabacter antarcticus 307]|uniref:DUF2065 domain-containing protein n=1 Tax=Octadecabacter antarcticus 307 TaxID=391626 RepID=M9R506_9RHOB|nr:DUF2065 domain-containing protein [Octadecabacter antarcticus]AGI67302.1 hypothetical protein OAN307_c16290 [Octadecabacter antarcticus 307]
MGIAILALGLVLIVEGLVYALAPSLVEDLLAALRQMSLETRRLVGLAALAMGVALVWVAANLGVLG